MKVSVHREKDNGQNSSSLVFLKKHTDLQYRQYLLAIESDSAFIQPIGLPAPEQLSSDAYTKRPR